MGCAFEEITKARCHLLSSCASSFGKTWARGCAALDLYGVIRTTCDWEARNPTYIGVIVTWYSPNSTSVGVVVTWCSPAHLCGGVVLCVCVFRFC